MSGTLDLVAHLACGGASLFYFLFLCILFWALLGLSCWASSSHDAQASHCGGFLSRNTGSKDRGSAALVFTFSCPEACGILIPDQGLNPHLLHWQADS